jgi:MSHA biogenesis protein MshP
MNLKRQRGLSMVFAIFLMVAIAGLASVMVRLIASANIGASQDVTASRARQAALSGMDVAVYQWINGGATWCDNHAGSGALLTSTPAPGYQVRIQCTRGSNAFDSGGPTAQSLETAKMIITACSSGTSCPDNTSPNRMGYVERRVEATIAR